MTNSDLKRKNIITPEKAAVILPTVISSFAAFIVLSSFAIPKYVSSNKINNEFKEFQRKVNELPDLNLQAILISRNLEKLNNEKSRIINLVSGRTNLDTFIKRLGLIGERNNISFQSLTPISSLKFVGSQNSELQNELNINPDPLLVEGVKKYSIDVKFNAQYADLLSFFRELEFQENIILFRDVSIELQKDNNETSEVKSDSLLVSLKMHIYGKI